MPVTTAWRAGNRKGYQVGVVTNPTGPLTGLLLAESAKGIMDRLGPGYALLISIKLPGVGWRSVVGSSAAVQTLRTSFSTRMSTRGLTTKTAAQASARS